MYQAGVLHCIYGITAVGKSTLGAYVPIVKTAQFFLKTKGKIPDKAIFVVIDTDGGFDFERLEQICECNDVKYSEIEKRLIYQNPQSFDEQHKYIAHSLEKDTENRMPLVVALDPAVAIYRGIILRTPPKNRASVISQYLGKIDMQLQILRYFARARGAIATVTTWHVSEVGESISGVPPEQPFIGGSGMGFLPKIIIGIEPYYYPTATRIVKDSTLRMVTLWKHRSKPSGMRAVFELCDTGVCDPPEKIPKGGTKDEALAILAELKKKKKKHESG